MTLPRLMALNRYWDDHPPLHFLMAAWMRYKPKHSGRDSWVDRGLTVDQCIKEALKFHPVPNIGDFTSDMAAAGMGFIVERG
jgi:hypothetical protein